MAGARFDILFAGKLIGDADPETVRGQIQQQFKLPNEVAERLFSGRTVTVKRGVDTATASRYRKIFRDAKALIEIRPVNAPSQLASGAPPEPSRKSNPESSLEPADIGSPEHPDPESSDELEGREPAEYEPLEQTQSDAPKVIDLRHLSLVPGNDWTLEDCEPQLPPVEFPDISHLSIVTLEPDADKDKEE